MFTHIITRGRFSVPLTEVLSLAMFATAHAQSTTTLQGRVVDPKGAAVPGVKVTVRSQATGVERIAQLIITAALLVFTVLALAPLLARAQQSAEPKRALVLYWYNKDHPWNVKFDQSFQAALQAIPAGTVEYYPEYLETNRFPGEKQAQLLRDYLQQKYADRAIDVVVANSDASLDFLLKYRDDLFPHTPIVFVAARHPKKEELAAGPGLTGIINVNTHRKTLDLALSLHPDTEHVFVISGTLQHDKKFETLAREELQGYESKVRVTYLTDLAPDELIAKTKSLPKRSIVLYVWQQAQNDQGKVIESADIFALIAGSAPVPTYGMTHQILGHGIVGGYIITSEATGTKVAEIALRITNGARAQDIPVESAPTSPMFDWRQLQRWGIGENRLPHDGIVLFKESTFWRQYKGRIIGVFALFVVQTLLIAFLLLERARRQRAMRGLRESEERFSKAFHSSPQPMSIASIEEGRYIDVNERFLEMSGYTHDEIIGNTSLDLKFWEGIAARAELVRPLKEGRSVRNLEAKFRAKNGHFRFLLSSADLIELSGQPCILVASSDITERKRAEERLRSYFELPLIGMAITSPDRRFVEVNQKLCDILGYSMDQLTGMSWVDVTHPDDVAENVRLLDETLRGKTEGYVMDKRFIHRDGHIVYASISARCARRADRTVDYLALIVQDITQRKQAEDRLMESEAQLRLLTELIPQHVWTAFPGNAADFRNRRWLDYTGMTIEEVRHKGWMTALHPDDHERVIDAIREASSRKGIYEVEVRLKGVDGQYRWFLARAIPQLDQEGSIIKWYGTNTDIEDRKRAEEALRESAERLRHALEAGRMGVWERDMRTDAVKWSKESYTIMGLSPSSLEPSYQTWSDRVHPDDLPVVVEKMRKAIEEKGNFRHEYRIIWPDGSVRWAEGHGKPVYDEDGQCLKVSGLIVDTTERKLAYLRRNTQYAISHILSEAASVADAASRLLQVICESLGWEFGEIWLVDREADHLTFLESWSQPSRELAEFASASRQFTFPPGVGLPGRVWKSRQPVWITDVADSNFPRASLARRAGLHNGFGFPALLGDEMLGVMVFFSREVREPDEDLLRMMASIGSQIGQFAERKQAEEALRESEARFRNMADNAPVMVWMTEADGACSFVSQSWYEFTGQTPETGLGFGWVAALHPDDRERSEKTFLAANEKREAFRIEYRVRRIDGEYRWASDSARPRFGSQGEFLGYIGSVVDITETKRAELNTQFINQLDFELSQITDADKIIRLAASRLGEYLGVTSCYVIEVNPAAGLAFVRESWEGWRNAGPSIVGEYRISDFVTPECLDEFEAGRATVVKDVMNDPRIRDFASKYKSLGVGAFISIPALNERQWEANLTVDYPHARDWRPDETQLMRDITARLWPAYKRARAAEALRDSEERLRHALEAGRLGVWERDMRTDAVKWSKETYTIMGLSPFNLEPHYQTWSDRVHPDDLPVANEKMRKAIEEKGDFRYEYRIIWPDGSVRWVEGHGKPVYDEDGQCLKVRGLIVDITETKRAELNTQFINQLDFELSQIADANEIIRLATGRLGEYLGVASCFVIEVNPAADLAVVRESWNGWRLDGKSIVGEYRISDFTTPEFREALEAGHTAVVNDVKTDPRTRDSASIYEAFGVGAFVTIPVLNEKHWEASLNINHPHARDWRPDETQLMRDITARLWPAFKRARAVEALRESEERFRQLAENIGAAFFITEGFSETPPGQIRYVSPAYEKIWGRSRESLYQDTRSWLEAVHPDDIERVLGALRSAGRAQFDEEFRIMRPDGEVRWVHDRVFPIRDEDGEIYRLAGIVEDITGRKMIEEALRESEERYRSVVESQTELICRYLPDTTLTFVNDAYCRYFGKLQEELIGTKFLDFIPEPAREVARKHIESLVENPRVEIDEHEVLLPNGGIGWQQWVDHALLDANGKVVEFQAVGRDITERKLVEEERREGEERLRLALEAGRMGAWEWDVENDALKWSKEHYTIMGLEPFSVAPKDYSAWADRVHPDDLQVAGGAIRRAIEEKREYRCEYRIIWPDGSVRWVEGRGKPIYDEGGQCLKVSGLVVDITERKQIEEKRREGEERLRLALEAGRMGAWEWDTRTNAVKWSKEHYTVMGLMPFSVEPDYHTWADRVRPDDLPVAEEAMRRAIEEKGEYRCEYRVIWPDGSLRWVEGRGKPVYDEGGQCLKLNGLIVDISERKEAEEALRESEEALRKSYARIEDLAGRLIASQEEERRHIARELHDDLNQQVAALAIGISRLRRQFPDAGAAVQEQIVKLRNKTDLLSERIRQVSHELHSSVLQHVGLPAALNSYCAEFSDREGIAVALDIGDGIEGVSPEAALCLYRVAQESLRNVARHSGARRAVVTLARANGAVELRVADQGVGFDPGQAHEYRGLGLVSMEERVKLLHGSFVLTTRPGAGTELRAKIPLRGNHEQTTGIVG